MRVLHLHDAPQIHGGATSYLRQLLSEMGSRGVENHLFRLDGSPSGMRTAGETGFVYADPGSALRRRRDFHRHCSALQEALEDCLRRVRPQLVHVQNCAVFRATVFSTLAKAKIPVLFTVHDYSLADPNPHGRPWEGLSGGLRKWLDQRSMERSRAAVLAATTRFLCPTQALMDGLALPRERSTLLRLPIQPAEAPELPRDRLRLFFAGTLYRSKGVDVLLEALSRVQGAAQSAVFELAGEGDQAPALQEQAARIVSGPSIRFLGQLDAPGMDAAYGRANLQVLPSRVAENSPLTVLEAGARGRPAAATAQGGVPELLADGRGFPFPPEDPAALAALLDRHAEDLSALAAVGAHMRAWVRQEFDPEQHWAAIQTAYEELAR